MSNIRNNNSNPVDAKLHRKDYYDISLYNGPQTNICSVKNDIDACLISNIDFNDHDSILTRQIKSNVSWDYATVSDEIVRIPNAALTMGDNGYYPPIFNTTCALTDSTNTYLNQVKDTKLVLNPLRHNTFFLTKVSEANNVIDYSTELINDEVFGQYAQLRGGFYQGFFKLDGVDYQTLPTRYTNGFTMVFWLRKDDVKTEMTLNEIYPENKGFFFYIGTRAENKFWKPFDANTNCDETNYGLFSQTTENTYTFTHVNSDGTSTLKTLFDFNTTTTTNNGFLIYGKKRTGKDETNTYTFKTVNETKEITIPKVLSYSYPTNPFLVFGRNKGCGCKTSNDFKLGHMTICDVKNNFEKTIDGGADKYNSTLDLVDNAYGFRITDDYEFEYRYVTSVNGEVKIISDKTDQIIPKDQWFSISLRWLPEEVINDESCDLKPRNGKLMVYINCYLKHTFYNFPEILLRPLNDFSEKQLAVPYNISLGGGTQGLRHSVTLNGPDPNDADLLLERTFGGTFIGAISKFSIYDCDLKFEDVQELCVSQKEQFQPEGIHLKQDEEIELILTDETRKIKIDF